MSTETTPAVTSVTSRPKLTAKQSIVLSAIADGKSIPQANQLAGYRARTSAFDVYRNLKERMGDVFDGAGLTEQVIAQRLAEQLYATKTIVATMFGKITDSMEVADNQAIGKAIDTAARIRGMMDSDNDRLSIGNVNILVTGSEGLPGWARGRPGGEAEQALTDVEQPPEPEQTAAQRSQPRPPLSTVEGTEIGPPAPTRIRQVNFGGVKAGTGTKSGGATAGASTKSKRAPRLPGWRKK